MVLLTVDFGNIHILLVRAPGNVGEVHLALVDAGVAGSVKVHKLLRSAVPNTHSHLVAFHTGHRILDVSHLCFACLGVDQWIVYDHTLIHTIEGQP